jgi:glycosyltransferase involved in cell wall biosynthesis
MKEHLSFRIVIPSLNQEMFLEQTLKSIFEQDYPGEIQVALVDGGSKDGSLSIIRRYSKKLTYWRSHPDQGQASAIVEGFDNISGEISFYLNSDDVLLPDALIKVNDFFQEYPDNIFVFSNRMVIDELSNIKGYWKLPKYSKKKIRQTDLIPQETMFWRSSVMKKIGTFDPSLHFAMDYDFIYRLMDQGPGKRLDTFLSAFRYHSKSKTHNLLSTTGKTEIALLKKRYGVMPIPLIDKILSLGIRVRTKIWQRFSKSFQNDTPKKSVYEIWNWKEPPKAKIKKNQKIARKSNRKGSSLVSADESFFERNSQVVLSLIVSIIAGTSSLLYSYNSGRLSQQLSYDDVTYIIDAGGRIRDGDWFFGVFSSPPHSPYQTLLSVLGIKIFGFHDFSPYILGAVSFVILLTLFAYSLPIGKRHSFYISFILSFSSIGYFGFTEFRPDLSYALVTAIGLVYLIQKNCPIQMGIGFLLMAFWIKPSFFLHTLVLFITALGIRTLIAKRNELAIQHKRKSKYVFILGLILFLSHYVFALEKTINYFIRGTVTEDSVWSFPDSISNLGAYFWYSGFQRVSSTVVLGSIMGIGLIYSSFRVIFDSRSDMFKFRTSTGIQFWILAFVSFSIISLGRIPNHFFGATAALLFFASSMVFIASTQFARYILITFLSFSLVMAAMSLNRTNLDFPSRDASVKNPASKMIFSKMEQNQIQKMYIPFQGQVNAVTLGWENMKNEGAFIFDNPSVMPTLEESVNRANELGAILCPKETADYYSYLPSAETTELMCSRDSILSSWKKIDMANNYFILKKVK